MATILIIGGGGREHAITWKISQSKLVKSIFVAPGSYSIQQVAKTKNVPLDIKDFKCVSVFCKENKVDLVIVGPEDPLANGIADYLTNAGFKVFGPQKEAAQIESDKSWAKAFMDKHGIPTAQWKSFTKAEEAKTFIKTADFPALVVKASGLAAGKGVIVAVDQEQACKTVDEILMEKKFGTAGQNVVIEELLTGEEVSVLAFCDGKTVLPMLPAQDHKRIFDNDQGPNTGGMGAYCPCPLISKEDYEYIKKEVLQKAVDGFKKDKIQFVGVLYAGIMLTPQGPKVLEFNCRFGDPETEVILPLLESDLYELMLSCCNGTLDQQKLKWKENTYAVGVVMASKGYPETSSKGQVINNIEKVEKLPNYIVFHCGTALKENKIVTNGGRVLIIVNLSSQLNVAAAKATYACNLIEFEGRQYRKDIAHKGIARSILKSGKITYKDSGVDITAGNELIEHIKPAAKSTNRSGVIGGLGGFGGLFDVKAAGYNDPLLVSGTDGVGTKLKIAQEVGQHNTIGIDLVAMCVNDVLAHGAEPLFFLDYFACGSLNINVAQEVVSGIAKGCQNAGCALIGGETAEMPDMYPPGDYDLAGFTVGAVERHQLMPRINDIKVNDVIIGLPSSGIHSNGFSLVRKILKISGVKYNDITPFSGKTFGEELLTPTKIYVKSVIAAIKTGKVKAFAHITGGGLIENIPRVLPEGLGVELDASQWYIPKIFGWLAAAGGVGENEMLRTFNCGIGGILIVDEQNVNEVLKIVLNSQHSSKIGKIVKLEREKVKVKNFTEIMEQTMKPFISSTLQYKPKKRVGVLISGSGTNLQALIDATQNSEENINAEIVLVISNKENVEGLRRAERANIKTMFIDHKKFNSRVDFDMEVHKNLIKAGVEIVCLAGFMRILSGEFTRLWKGKLLNIHPALLPLFKGTNAQKQALEAGVRVTGCTVHFVEEDVDAGAIITQEIVPIEINDSVETLVERIKIAEHKAFPHALKLIANDNVKLGEDNKLIWSL